MWFLHTSLLIFVKIMSFSVDELAVKCAIFERAGTVFHHLSHSLLSGYLVCVFLKMLIWGKRANCFCSIQRMIPWNFVVVWKN